MSFSKQKAYSLKGCLTRRKDAYEMVLGILGMWHDHVYSGEIITVGVYFGCTE